MLLKHKKKKKEIKDSLLFKVCLLCEESRYKWNSYLHLGNLVNTFTIPSG